MRYFIFVIIFTLCKVINGEFNAHYFCADLYPQSQVDIDQLMGMWYGVEIISHKQEEEPDVKHPETCPILYFTEDRTQMTSTISPLHKDFKYQQPYGSGYGQGYQERNYNADHLNEETYNSQLNPPYNTPNEDLQNQHDRQMFERVNSYYNKRYGTTGGSTDYNRNRHPYDDIRRLRLLWDENGKSVEYTMRYDVTSAGLWLSSGPQNGSSLEPQYNYFAGTVQVLKAVGNHLVLIFCYQLPEQQLYTVLLSRVPKLAKQEIHGVHNMLNRKGLSTSNVKKVCAHSGNSGQSIKIDNTVFMFGCGVISTVAIWMGYL